MSQFMPRLFAVPLLIAFLLLSRADDGDALGQETKRQSLRVLFVGNDPKQDYSPRSYQTGPDADRFDELMKERTPAFEKLLREHFETVTVVIGKDYQVALSDDYDVTVFDVLPPPIGEREVAGWKKKIRLPADFSNPAVMIGNVAPMTLGRFGWDLRLDHL